MNLLQTTVAAAFAFALPLVASADAPPPADAKTISDVVETLKEQGYEPIVEVTYDDNQWQAEAYKNGERFDLDLDAKTGEIVRAKRDS